MKITALLLAAGIVSLTSCSSETLGYVDKSRLDASEKKVADIQKELTDTQDKLALSQKVASDCQAHKFSMFQSGGRTWRLNTVTGESCIALTSNADWKTKQAMQQSCACTDLFEDTVNPNELLRKAYCGW